MIEKKKYKEWYQSLTQEQKKQLEKEKIKKREAQRDITSIYTTLLPYMFLAKKLYK